MMLPSRCLGVVLALSLIAGILAFAEVPNLITYQGRLTDDAGLPVVDNTYVLIFCIYDIDVGGVPLWIDTIDATTSNGLFTTLLGSEQPLSPTVFDGATRFLGITIMGETEMLPRTPIVSVPYAMVAGSALSEAVDCHSCDTIFINSTGPEVLSAVDADTALSISNSGDAAQYGLAVSVEGTNDLHRMTAVKGFCFDNSATTHDAIGGWFVASGGSGSARYGVYGEAQNNATMWPAYGVYGRGQNSAVGGTSYGGFFSSNNSDPSDHYGACGYAIGFGQSQAVGLYGYANNADNGDVIGGLFSAEGSGTGIHYGIRSVSEADNDSISTGVYGYATNYGKGRAYGGEFTATSHGTGRQFGVVAIAEADNDSSAYGVYGEATRTSPGYVYGGYFTASGAANTDGYAIYGYISSPGPTTGLYSYATGNGIGAVRSAKLICNNNGTGVARGVDAYVLGGQSSNDIYGVDILAEGESNYTGTSYGGYFRGTARTFAGNQYGLYSLSESMSNTYGAFGMYGRSQHYGSGNSYASYFLSDSTGTGTGYGVRSVALTKGTTTGYGINSVAANRSTGAAYGGYFESYDLGSGDHYGIYAKAPFTGYAGYFSGHVRITGGLTVVGTKSAAVKMDDGDYRLVYCQESPENWFEDFGEGRLVNGRTVIAIDPLYSQTANTGMTYHVFLTPQDEPVVLAVANRTATSFEVRGPEGSNVGFSYRIVAKRRGYEDVRLARMSGPTPEQTAAEEARLEAERRTDDEAAEQDRIKHQEADAKRQAEQTVLPEDAQY
jgi:hypothetical protein